MRAICESVYGASIPIESRFWGEIDETCYAPLKVGDEYCVYAIMFVVDRIDFLVFDEGIPIWAPGFMFKVIDANLPSGWGFCHTRSMEGFSDLFEHLGVSCIVGYSLLVSDYGHYVGIAERDDEEVQRFVRLNRLVGGEA